MKTERFSSTSVITAEKALTAVIRKGTTGAAVITETDDSIQNRLRSYKKNKM